MNDTTYTVAGMSCDHCARAVTDEVSGLPGVTRVDVDVAAGHVRMIGEQPLDQASVRAAVEAAGYEVTS